MRLNKLTMVAVTAFAAAWTASGAARAAAPLLHVQKSVTIAAPAAKVWDVVKNFDGLATWLPALASDSIVSGTNNTPGAVRLLTLKDGGTIKEKLLEYDDAGHRFRYSIVEGVLPVSHYSASLVVTAIANDKSLVTWSGRFKRKNVGDAPADNENDKTATDTISAVFQAGLDNLKKTLAAK